MAFCSECGNDIETGKFCNKCGSNIETQNKINIPFYTFRKWFNKRESKATNFIYVVLCFVVISFSFYIVDVFQKYVIGLPLNKTSFGEYPFSGSYLVLFSWLFFGAPLLLLISFLISRIKFLRVKTVKVFLIFTFFEFFLFIKNFQKIIYPALNYNKSDVEAIQKKVSDYNDKKTDIKTGVSKLYKDNFVKGCLINATKSLSQQDAKTYCVCMINKLSSMYDSDEKIEEELFAMAKDDLVEIQVSCLDR